jgi:hypothetical protein
MRDRQLVYTADDSNGDFARDAGGAGGWIPFSTERKCGRDCACRDKQHRPRLSSPVVVVSALATKAIPPLFASPLQQYTSFWVG